MRASDFYGPGATEQSLFGTVRFLDPLFAGKPTLLIGDIDQPHSFTYVEDFGRALAVAALDPQAYGQGLDRSQRSRPQHAGGGGALLLRRAPLSPDQEGSARRNCSSRTVRPGDP